MIRACRCISRCVHALCFSWCRLPFSAQLCGALTVLRRESAFERASVARRPRFEYRHLIGSSRRGEHWEGGLESNMTRQ